MFERGKESLMEVSENPAVSPTKKINYVEQMDNIVNTEDNTNILNSKHKLTMVSV